MVLLAINWASVGVQVAQLLLALSILVILHEFGHYITAKWFGCRVEKFFLFFDPWFALVKKKVGDTIYARQNPRVAGRLAVLFALLLRSENGRR